MPTFSVLGEALESHVDNAWSLAKARFLDGLEGGKKRLFDGAPLRTLT